MSKSGRGYLRYPLSEPERHTVVSFRDNRGRTSITPHVLGLSNDCSHSSIDLVSRHLQVRVGIPKSNLTEWKEKHHYITVKGSDGKDKRAELNQLLVRQRAVVCRGTTCFTTKQAWPIFPGARLSGNLPT